MGLGPGKGATPHIADAHGGRVGVGIRKPFPCLDGEQFGSVAGVRLIDMPVKVFVYGDGVVKPAVRGWRKANIWVSSLSLSPSLPTAMSSFFFPSGAGHQLP